MQIALEQLEALLRTLEDKKVAEFEYEDEKIRLRIALGRPPTVAAVAQAITGPGPAGQVGGAAAGAIAAVTTSGETVDASVSYITSPFVGTFYRAPSPDAENFVEVGTAVKKGQPLCIIEAMKLMNEIESEHDGAILEILVESGKSVEFGQKLFKLKKA
jgi:acetyl-CoA carboxylase biotin carboxyl carrier protein